MIRQFMRIKEIAEELQCTDAYVRKLAAEMHDYIPGRYKLTDFFGNGKALAIRFAAIQDYSLHRHALAARKPVPEYNPTLIERDLGLTQAPAAQTSIMSDEDLKKLANYITASVGNRLAAV